MLQDDLNIQTTSIQIRWDLSGSRLLSKLRSRQKHIEVLWISTMNETYYIFFQTSSHCRMCDEGGRGILISWNVLKNDSWEMYKKIVVWQTMTVTTNPRVRKPYIGAPRGPIGGPKRAENGWKIIKGQFFKKKTALSTPPSHRRLGKSQKGHFLEKNQPWARPLVTADLENPKRVIWAEKNQPWARPLVTADL